VTLGKSERAKIDREGLQRELTNVSRKNEKYFVIGIVMAVVLFIALVVAGFVQLGTSDSFRAVPPIFGSSAALVVWRMLKTWREKSYTDCILALVPNVDEETLKSIVRVLVKKV